MKKRIITTVIFLAAMVLVSCIMVQVNHSGRVSSNGRRLGEALKQVNKTEITWDEVVPFEWDFVSSMVSTIIRASSSVKIVPT